ncbi:MAG TPA: hypothetical protein PKY96_01040, partial [Flavobacteriales bacterium]|nr:hypothetical protein [Flavobacteriales bacterium]
MVYTSWDTELLCSALNSPCSNANPVAAGMVFVDDNGNGVLDDGEPGYPGVSIHVQPINVTYGTSTAGAYTIPLPPGDYTLSATTTIPWVQSIAPPAYDVSLWDPLDPSLGNDFAVTLFADLFDLSISLAMPLAKPGVLTNGYITYKNLGDGPMDGTVNLTLAAVCQYILGFPAASASAFNTASWNFSALQPGEVRQINFRFVTSESVSAGFVLDSYAEIQPLVGDATPGNNSSNCLTEVVASYDPNDK